MFMLVSYNPLHLKIKEGLQLLNLLFSCNFFVLRYIISRQKDNS